MYLGMFNIFSRAIPVQNHLGGWSILAPQTQWDHAQLFLLGAKVGFFILAPEGRGAFTMSITPAQEVLK